MLNPFRLPVHPAVVHFPIALLTLVWGMLIMRYATGETKWDSRARMLHVIAVASIPFVLGTALIDTRGLGFILDARWDAPLIWHALGGLVVVLLIFGHFMWRRRYAPDQLVGRLAVADLTLASVSFWGVVVVGLIAGEMVFRS